MNSIYEAQLKLKRILDFRILVFVVASILMLVYFFIPTCFLQLGNILIGIACSAGVWSLVELFDLATQTYCQYVTEKNDFFGGMNDEFEKLREIFKEYEQAEQVPWDKVNDCVEDIYNYLYEFSFKSSVFVLTEEWEKITNYIERLHWKMFAYVFEKESSDSKDLRKKSFMMFLLK